MPAFGEKFDFAELMEMACVPVYKMLEAHTNPFIMNKQVINVGDKLWNGVIDGCLSQVSTYDSGVYSSQPTKGKGQKEMSSALNNASH
mmetsp:Transcript_40592/g.29909  ORF Transcript_40592/g.29909 Transcript_40592/m.29909 type:complete len:88 (-) Transcript_40592:433-696(-)